MSSLPLLSLMNQQISIRRKLADPTTFYHEDQTFRCETAPARVEIRQSLSYGSGGSQIPSYATIYTTAVINRNDEIILPDGSVRKALSVAWAVDGNGAFSHSVVTV